MINFDKEHRFIELNTKKWNIRIGKNGFFIGKVSGSSFKSPVLLKSSLRKNSNKVNIRR